MDMELLEAFWPLRGDVRLDTGNSDDSGRESESSLATLKPPQLYTDMTQSIFFWY